MEEKDCKIDVPSIVPNSMTLRDAIYIAVIALHYEKERVGGYDSKACGDAEKILRNVSDFLSTMRL